MQNSKPKLMKYASERMSEALENYSITELELCGLTINITGFVHLLTKVDLDAIVNHFTLTLIIKSKTAPDTSRTR